MNEEYIINEEEWGCMKNGTINCLRVSRSADLLPYNKNLPLCGMCAESDDVRMREKELPKSSDALHIQRRIFI